jgi:rare lipoprotein A
MAIRWRTRRARLLVAVLGAALTLIVGRSAEPARMTDTSRIQHGLASYYGPGFHGRATASGLIFDQRQMVAAHRTLPLGTVVRVTNLQNGRAVRLRVIDRGPYGRNVRKGAIIDVSKGAARRLHFIRDGLVFVRVEVVDPVVSAQEGH